MRIPPEISGMSVVLAGTFNPAILTPAWFELHGLLPSGTAETAELHLAHRQATIFEADWLRLEVNANQFIAHVTQEPFVRVSDLTERVFREHLTHTPLQALGINREVHFRVRKASERVAIGRALVPTEPWGELGRQLELDHDRAGMTSLTMSQYPRDAATTGGGQVNITIEPSRRIPEAALGVYVRVNDHYGNENDDVKPNSNVLFMDLLAANFDRSQERSDKIIDHVMSLAELTES